MKIKLFVLAGLAVAVTAIVAASLFVSKDSPTSVCRAFLTAIEEGDAAKSYEMFTARGKSFNTPQEWRKEVAILQVVYDNEEPKPLGDSVILTDPATNEETGGRHTYLIQNGDNKYKTTCFTTVTEPDKIDSFSSEAYL